MRGAHASRSTDEPWPPGALDVTLCEMANRDDVRRPKARRISVRRAAAVTSMVMAAGAAGCGGNKACPEAACPTVGEDAAPGDYRVPLGGKDAWAFVDISLATMDASPAFSEFPLLGGELVFSKPNCSADGACRTSLKKLRLDLAPFPVGLSDGSHVSYDAISVSYETPITLDGQVTTYTVPVGTVTHACARVNGRSWHATAATTVPTLLKIDEPGQLLAIDGVIPLVMRADDPSCSTITLQARVSAIPTLPWTLVAADGGDAAP